MSVPKEKHRNLSHFLSVARCVLYGSVIAFFSLPFMGLGTALPFAIVIGLLAGIGIEKEKRFCFYISTALLTLLLTLFYNYGMKRAIVMTVLNTVSALLAVLAVRAVKTMKAAKTKAVHSKSLAVLTIAAVAVLALYVFGTGNAVGWIIGNIGNSRYIRAAYGENVKPCRTFYSPENGLYLTEITFDGSDGARYFVGAKDEAHFSRDDYRDFCLNEMMPDFLGYYQRGLQYKTGTMDILFPHDTVLANLTPDSGYANLLPLAVCVIRDENYIGGEEDFRSIYHYAFDTPKGSDRGFGNVSMRYAMLVLAGRDIATGQMYFAVKEADRETVFPDAKQTYRELHDLYGFSF